ncbi:unnamed protein product [Caenorhabditis nigoni]
MEFYVTHDFFWPDRHIATTRKISIRGLPLTIFIVCSFGLIYLITICCFKCMKAKTSQNVTSSSIIHLESDSEDGGVIKIGNREYLTYLP